MSNLTETLAAERSSVETKLSLLAPQVDESLRIAYDGGAESISTQSGDRIWFRGGAEAERVQHQEGLCIEVRVPGGFELSFAINAALPAIDLRKARIFPTEERRKHPIPNSPKQIKAVPFQTLADKTVVTVNMETSGETIGSFTEGHVAIPAFLHPNATDSGLMVYDEENHRILFVDEKTDSDDQWPPKRSYKVRTPDLENTAQGYQFLAEDKTAEEVYQMIKDCRLIQKITNWSIPGKDIEA